MAPLHRAYSRLEIKSVDAEQRVITGIATSASTDRMGDVVEPAGAQFTLPIPLLWQHDSKQPIGEVYAAKATKAGIEISARIAKTDLPGLLKDRLDMAWQSIALQLVRGLSIGFQSLEEAYDTVTGGYHFLQWQWLELSAVTIPANQDASIQTIKSLDVGLAPSGTEAVVDPPKRVPGPSGKSRVVPMRTDRTMKKSYADQIAGFEATRAAKVGTMDSILEKSADTGTTLDAAQKEEHDTLVADVAEIDEHLVRLRAAEKREKAAAVEVKGGSPREGLQAREGAVITIERTLPPGILFTRAAMCLGMARGNAFEAREMAKAAYGDHAAQVVRTVEAFGREMGKGRRDLVERTAVTGGTTVGSHYLDDMVPYNVMNDFVDFLRPGSIIGKFGGPNPGGGPNYPSLNRVGFNERVSGMSTGFVAGWKGEGLPALPTAAVTFNTALLYNNMSALAVLMKEAIRFSNPSAEARVRDDLGRAVNSKLDLDFIDPAKAANGTTSPASITNGVVATGVTGTTAAFLISDVATLLKQFTTNNLSAFDLVLIMSASQALEISMMTTTLGALYFPNISMLGGNFRGLPVITSEHLQSVGSPAINSIVAVKAGDIYLADDGVVTIDASDQASLEMVDSSSQNAGTGTGASLVSLWQTGAVGLMATREITWKKRRSVAVQYISPAAYVA